jgi:hypothetical protein
MAATKRQLALGDLADELGMLDQELAPVRAKLAREKALREALRDGAKTHSSTEEKIIEGRRFIVTLGPRSLVSEVNVKKLERLVSWRCLVGLATITQKALIDGKIDPAVQAQVIETSQTGYRHLAISEKGDTPA